MTTINLNFQLKDPYGRTEVGIAGPIVSLQTIKYIRRMEQAGETAIVNAMNVLKNEANIEPYTVNVNNEEYAIVSNWLITESGFYGESMAQLKAAFGIEEE